jgi:hypothetical protein
MTAITPTMMRTTTPMKAAASAKLEPMYRP